MQTLSTERRRFFEMAATQYQKDLAASTSAQAYLAKRGIGQEVALAFRLGVVTSPLVGDEQFRDRLSIPYLTPSGVVNMAFRCLKSHVCKDEGCPKYLAMEGVDRNLFNVGDLRKQSPFICIAEGELDALTLSMCGLPAVGVPGVENWKAHWGRCLEDFDTVYVFADGDKAGRKFASFLAKEVRTRTVRMPPDEDVNSIYVKGGADALQRLLKG